MRQLAALTAAAAFAVALGFSGTALALGNELDNEGAEEGAKEPWTGDGDVDMESRTLGTDARTGGVWFFDMSAEVDLGGSRSLTQRVVVDGCSLSVGDVDLLGTWAASGFILTQFVEIEEAPGGDFGTLKIEFSSGESTTENGLRSADQTTYVEKNADGDIPVAATFADLTISGTADPNDQIFPDVQWDDMVFEIDCVAAFAKISGTKETREGRKDPVYAFGGAVGTLEGDGLVGAITINYRDLGPTSCTFTPTAIVYDDDTSVAIEADYVCTNGADGDATIDMTAKDADPDCDESDKKSRKNRGSINVTVTPDTGPFIAADLDIFATEGVSGTENCLATGNVIIAGPVEE